MNYLRAHSPCNSFPSGGVIAPSKGASAVACRIEILGKKWVDRKTISCLTMGISCSYCRALTGGIKFIIARNGFPLNTTKTRCTASEPLHDSQPVPVFRENEVLPRTEPVKLNVIHQLDSAQLPISAMYQYYQKCRQLFWFAPPSSAVLCKF